MSWIARVVWACAHLILLAVIAVPLIGALVGWGSTAAIIAYIVAVVAILIPVGYHEVLKHSEAFYRREIGHGLERAYHGTGVLEGTVDDPKDLRLIVLSDQHKGTR